MKYFLMFLLSVVWLNTHAQSATDDYTYRYLDDTVTNLIYRDIALKYSTDSKKNYLYSNNTLLDSLSSSFGKNDILTENSIFLHKAYPHPSKKYCSETEITKISHQDKKISKVGRMDSLTIIGTYRESFLAIGQYIPNLHDVQKLYEVDAESLNVKLLYDFRSLIAWEGVEDFNPRIQKAYASSKSNKLLVETGMWAGGGVDDLSYFIVDLNTSSIQNATTYYTQQNLIEKEGVGIQAFFPDVNDSMYHIETFFHDTTAESNSRRQCFILDHHFKKVASTLAKVLNVSGYRYQDNSTVALMVESETDEYIRNEGYRRGNLTFVPDYHLEKILYAIYHNQALTAYDLKPLSKQQLQLAKNMIFARHNYQFKNLYYQAFFNLFDFYSTEKMRKSRTQIMEDKLSYNDVQNSQLINQTIRRRD